MDGDWVCLHRKVLHSAVFSDANAFRLFAYCMLRARWKPGTYRTKTIERGQFGAVMGDIGHELGMSRQELRTAFKKLTNWEAVEVVNATNRFSIITVCHYSTYQNHIRTEQPTSNQPNGDLQPTNNQPATNQQPTQEKNKGTTEQGKQKQGEQKVARKRAPAFEPLAAEIPKELDSDAFHVQWAKWINHRKEIGHRLKPTMVDAQLEDFVLIGVERAVAMMAHTIKQGWQGLREPEANGQAKKRESTRIFD